MIESVAMTTAIELPPEMMVLDGLIEVTLSRREHILLLLRCAARRFLFVCGITRKLVIKPCYIPVLMGKF